MWKCGTAFHPRCAVQAGYGRDNAVMCCDGEVLKSGRRASASVSFFDADVELIVAKLSKVFQMQSDKFKNEMRTECFGNITTLTNKVAELSSQHDKHVSELSSLKTEVMELRMENVALRNRMDDAGRIDVENFCVEAQERILRCKNLMLLDVVEGRSTQISERIEFDINEVKKIFSALGMVNKFDSVLKVLRLGPVSNKPRPMKIITSSPEVVADVLTDGKKPENTNYRLYSDRTNLQREYMARLKQELAGRTEQGESYYKACEWST
ncbi:hypothetical protein HHI36_004835 [Cryptolaemus montrouzieri]|uniref:Uncharacterized protein n=1 Tax=Cryptolaemus montrouzieri TaxID=559131 RepID=A0ABD2NSP2_9CUCU